MPPMRIEDMVGFPVEAYPRDLFSFFRRLPDLFLFGALCYRLFVAFQARGKIWHPSKVLRFEVAVASIAFQSLFHVFLMIEGNRLLNL